MQLSSPDLWGWRFYPPSHLARPFWINSKSCWGHFWKKKSELFSRLFFLSLILALLCVCGVCVCMSASSRVGVRTGASALAHVLSRSSVYELRQGRVSHWNLELSDSAGPASLGILCPCPPSPEVVSGTQWVKAAESKPDSPCCVQYHTAKAETQLLQVVLWPPCVRCGLCAHTYWRSKQIQWKTVLYLKP